jgi:hypothetical protein
MARQRGGRKKKSGERFASGDLKPEKLGPTPERAAQRALLTQGADPALAESPLGILVARALIDHDTWSAAEKYASAKRLRFGSGQPGGSHLMAPGNAAYNPGLDTGSESGEAWAKAILADADAIFASRPRRHRDIFDNAVVYKRFPAWTGDRFLSPAARPELAILLDMLHDLAARFGMAKAPAVQENPKGGRVTAPSPASTCGRERAA